MVTLAGRTLPSRGSEAGLGAKEAGNGEARQERHRAGPCRRRRRFEEFPRETETGQEAKTSDHTVGVYDLSKAPLAVPAAVPAPATVARQPTATEVARLSTLALVASLFQRHVEEAAPAASAACHTADAVPSCDAAPLPATEQQRLLAKDVSKHAVPTGAAAAKAVWQSAAESSFGAGQPTVTGKPELELARPPTSICSPTLGHVLTGERFGARRRFGSLGQRTSPPALSTAAQPAANGQTRLPRVEVRNGRWISASSDCAALPSVRGLP